MHREYDSFRLHGRSPWKGFFLVILSGIINSGLTACYGLVFLSTKVLMRFSISSWAISACLNA
jgi:hypothetical protein